VDRKPLRNLRSLAQPVSPRNRVYSTPGHLLALEKFPHVRSKSGESHKVPPCLNPAIASSPAMACGLPVVASSRAGGSEIVNDRRNGMILRDPEDSQELAGLLRALCANPDLYRQIGGKRG